MALAKRSDEAILGAANLIVDNMMIGANDVDHNKYKREDFTYGMKRLISKACFEKLCELYQERRGQLTEREAVAIFRRPESAVVVWRQWCAKQAGELIVPLVLVGSD